MNATDPAPTTEKPWTIKFIAAALLTIATAAPVQSAPLDNVEVGPAGSHVISNCEEPKMRAVTACGNMFWSDGRKHDAVPGDACRLEQLWAQGGTIQFQRFYLDREVHLHSRFPISLMNSEIDTSSLPSNAHIWINVTDTAFLLANRFTVSSSYEFVLGIKADVPSGECSDLSS